jgi:diguanylate cyclase (GGDEF)-like protein/PAS domain S-box-containing protein
MEMTISMNTLTIFGPAIATGAIMSAAFAGWLFGRFTRSDARVLAYRLADAPIPMLMIDNRGIILTANTLLEQLFGYGAGELRGQALEILVPAGSRVRHAQLRREYLEHPLPRPMSERDLYGIHKSGRQIPIEVGLSTAASGPDIVAFATVIDISASKRAKEELETTSALMAAIIDSVPFSLIATDIDGNISAISPAAERMLGYGRDELVGKHTPALLHDPTEIAIRARELSLELQQPVQPGFSVFVAKPRQGVAESRVWTYVRKDGSHLPVQLTVSAMRDKGQRIVGFLGIAYDITEQKRKEDYLNYLAHHDVLTGLPNRALLHDRIGLALDRAHRFGQRVGIMVVDLDHFKRINDTLGHAAGDRLLATVAERLLACVRSIDTVARLGGDEFVVILSDIDDIDQALTVAEKILCEIGRAISHPTGSIQITPSIGLCLFPDHGEDIATLLKHADVAMYAAKTFGRGNVQVFSPASSLHTNNVGDP